MADYFTNPFFANFHTFISTMRAATLLNKKSFSHADKRAGVELRKAKVPQKAIKDQLCMSKAALSRILAFAKANPAIRMANRNYLRSLVTFMPRRLQEGIQKDGWTTHY